MSSILNALFLLALKLIPEEQGAELYYLYLQENRIVKNKSLILFNLFSSYFKVIFSNVCDLPEYALHLMIKIDPCFLNDRYLTDDQHQLEIIEKAFIKDYFEASLSTRKAAIWYAFFCYAVFSILDIWCLPSIIHISYSIRFIVCFLAVCVAYLIYFKAKFFERWNEIIISLYTILAGSGLIMMIAFSSINEIAYIGYYGGIMLVLMFLFFLARLRFLFVLITGFTILFVYNIFAIFFQNIFLGGSWNVSIFINTNYMLLTANFIGVVASWHYECSIRTEFLMRYMITHKLVELYRFYENSYPTPQQLLHQIYEIRHNPKYFRKFMLQALVNTSNNDLYFPN